MTFFQALILTWVTGWLLSSAAYVVSNIMKAKSGGKPFSMKDALTFIPNLFLLWPFIAMVYAYARIKTMRK